MHGASHYECLGKMAVASLSVASMITDLRRENDAQRSRLEREHDELASLNHMLACSEEKLEELQQLRSAALLAFMKEHALEEEARRSIKDARQRCQAWGGIIELQKQLARVDVQIDAEAGAAALHIK